MKADFTPYDECHVENGKTLASFFAAFCSWNV
jgi:hypothetical protein